VSKNGLFEPFIYKNDHFTKPGSGQTWGNSKEDRFSSGITHALHGSSRAVQRSGWCGNAFFAPCFILKNRTFTKTGSGQTQGNLNERDVFLQRLMPENQQELDFYSSFVPGTQVKKRSF
jgi:hypothetical protein